jgi:hypothetical protein
MIEQAILGVTKSSEPLKVRVRKIVASLEELYMGGRTLCVLGQLSTASIGTHAKENLRVAFAHWIMATSALAAESGMPPARARNFGEDWVASLQGALILQAATGDVGPFKRVMNSLLALVK